MIERIRRPDGTVADVDHGPRKAFPLATHRIRPHAVPIEQAFTSDSPVVGRGEWNWNMPPLRSSIK